jgi:hypothetical protein
MDELLPYFRPTAKVIQWLKPHWLVYDVSGSEQRFVDHHVTGLIFIRGFITCCGHCYSVVEVSRQCFERVAIKRLVISRTVEILGDECFDLSKISSLVTEHGTRLQ